MAEPGQGEIIVQRPSRESLGHMRHLRDALDNVGKEVPQVRGLAFFGSRARGQERQGDGRPSDLDTVVFYDGSEFTETGTFDVFDESGNVIPGFLEINQRHQNNKRLHEELKRELKQKISGLMTQRGLPVDIYSGFNGTVFVEDISQSSTDQALKTLKYYVDANKADEEFPTGIINSPAFSLASRFLLGVGDGLYQNRGYVLDKFEEMVRNGEDGEKYFRGLMNCVRELQTGSAQVEKKLPQTIQEARTFFRIK